MAPTYEELKGKTLAELRDIAKGLDDQEAIKGHTQLNKDHLLPLLCKALGIDAHLHHHVASGAEKLTVKARIRALKADRDKALAAHDPAALKSVRRQIHNLKHQLRSGG